MPGGLLLPLAVLMYYGLGAGWGACSDTHCEYAMSGTFAAILVIGLTVCSIGSVVYLARRRHEGQFSPSGT